MKLFHSIIVSVFIKNEDDYDSIKKTFLELFPFDLQEAKVKLSEKTISTYEDRTIKILEVRVERNRQINDFIGAVKDKLSSSDKKMIVKQLDSRLDDNLDFFFRLDKPVLIKDGKYIVIDHGDCYHFKCHVATFPQSKEKAKELLTEYFQ